MGFALSRGWGFLTKNQSSSFQPPDIFVPGLKSLSTVPEDRLWCPVRGLKWYLSRTKDLRGECKQLFITSIPPHRAASKDTIARWIVQAIQSSTSADWPSPSGNPAHAHEVRAMVTSWAFFRGVPMEDIIKAACWKSPSTFTSCYLKDVPQLEGRTGRTVLMAARAPSNGGDNSSGRK